MSKTSLSRKQVGRARSPLRDAGRPTASGSATASTAKKWPAPPTHKRRAACRRVSNSSAIIDVAAGLVFRDGKLLITKRFPDAHLGGLWEFPGGKREPTETFQECLARELHEELGIQVSIGPLVQAVTHDYRDKHVHLKFFRCQWKAKEPRPLGCEACQWVTREELRNFEFPEADALLLRKLQRNLRLWK